MIDLHQGVPGVNGPEPANYEEFWPYYVSQHLHPATRAIHVVGTVMGLACGAAVALRLLPARAVVAGPLLGYGPAWTSHFLIEKNKPASFGHPAWSFRADLRLLRRTWARTLGGDVQAVRTALHMSPDQQRLADVPELKKAA
jgi:hypothetical protein